MSDNRNSRSLHFTSCRRWLSFLVTLEPGGSKQKEKNHPLLYPLFGRLLGKRRRRRRRRRRGRRRRSDITLSK
jgi:hypothetical protein